MSPIKGLEGSDFGDFFIYLSKVSRYSIKIAVRISFDDFMMFASYTMKSYFDFECTGCSRISDMYMY